MGTVYHFSKSDLDFILSLAKIGHVHMLSSQVILTDSGRGISPKNIIGQSLKLPENWRIEWVSASNDKVNITFEILHNPVSA